MTYKWTPVLAFGLYLGAAIADATPAQREALQASVRPLLDDLRSTGDVKAIFFAVQKIMGETWTPAEDWSRAIKRLTIEPTTEQDQQP